MNIEPKLEAFLRKEKVLTAFKKNVNKLSHHSREYEYDDLGGAYTFMKTTEGHKYWWDLNKKYKQLNSQSRRG